MLMLGGPIENGSPKSVIVPDLVPWTYIHQIKACSKPDQDAEKNIGIFILDFNQAQLKGWGVFFTL